VSGSWPTRFRAVAGMADELPGFSAPPAICHCDEFGCAAALLKLGALAARQPCQRPSEAGLGGATGWVNTGYLDDLPPAEFEATFHATKRTDQPLVEI
jgi:hypothetical protein